MESLEGPRTEFLNTLIYFIKGFMDMHVNGKIQFGR